MTIERSGSPMWIRSQDGRALVKPCTMWVVDLMPAAKIYASSGGKNEQVLLGVYNDANEAEVALAEVYGSLGTKDKAIFQMPPADFAADFWPRCGRDLEECVLVKSNYDTECAWATQCRLIYKARCADAN
jgi:hypothetical protein